jgi:hypothetical protein
MSNGLFLFTIFKRKQKAFARISRHSGFIASFFWKEQNCSLPPLSVDVHWHSGYGPFDHSPWIAKGDGLG